jgi:hypothetical protein
MPSIFDSKGGDEFSDSFPVSDWTTPEFSDALTAFTGK